MLCLVRVELVLALLALSLGLALLVGRDQTMKNHWGEGPALSLAGFTTWCGKYTALGFWPGLFLA